MKLQNELAALESAKTALYINDNKREISHIFKTLYRGVEYEPICSGELIKYNDCNVEGSATYTVCTSCKNIRIAKNVYLQGRRIAGILELDEC